VKSKLQLTQHHQISDNSRPEDVLRQFITDLKDSIDIVENSLRDLRKQATIHGEEEIFSRLGQAIQSVNENIQSVIDYLHMKLKDGFIETEGKIALEILGRFSHVLRECSMPLIGFVNVAQRCKLSEEEFEHNIEAINHYSQRLVQKFKTLHGNCRIWLEAKRFDWEASDL